MGDGVGSGDGAGVDEVGVMIWFISGIPESSRPNPLAPLALAPEPPDAAAVSPAPPDAVLLEVAEPDDGATADAEAEETDETAARLFCDAPLVADCTPDIGD